MALVCVGAHDSHKSITHTLHTPMCSQCVCVCVRIGGLAAS